MTPHGILGVRRRRLGVVPDEIAAGHCVALSHPRHLTNVLDGDARAAVP